MNLKFLFLFFILSFLTLNAQKIYSEAYGEKQNPAIIFIHGGPSGNSNLFEATTAQNLADKGFYVIVYDRRGEGRSKDENARMTFEESFEDLLTIYKKYQINKAHILAHSFGGIIGTLFTEKYPQKVKSLILAGALVSQQDTYNHILKNAEKNFKNDKNKVFQISEIKKLNKNSAQYRKQCFGLASEMKYFTMPNPTQESKKLRAIYENGSFSTTSFRNHDSPIKFYQNEPRNNLNNLAFLKNIKKSGIPIYAVYGKQDFIFPENQLKDLETISGTSNYKLVDNCSHYLFVDQQTEFLKFITEKIK